MSGSERDIQRQDADMQRLPHVASNPAARTDQRAHSRYEVELEVGVGWSESNFYTGLTENVSEGGLFIATHQLRPVGTEIEVSLRLPDYYQPIRAVATVKWHRAYSGAADICPGMGVQFESMSTEHLAAIKRFLAQRTPLFYEE